MSAPLLLGIIKNKSKVNHRAFLIKNRTMYLNSPNTSKLRYDNIALRLDDSSVSLAIEYNKGCVCSWSIRIKSTSAQWSAHRVYYKGTKKNFIIGISWRVSSSNLRYPNNFLENFRLIRKTFQKCSFI